MTRVLLLGGTSEIGLAIVRAFAERSEVTATLLGRDADRLAAAAAQLGPGTVTGALDADALDTHPRVLADAFAAAGGFDVVILAVGTLGGQAALDAPRAEALALLQTNFLGAGSLLEAALQELRAQRSGTMIVLSSVAALRPRATLAHYGAAKAGLDALAHGLGDAARADGVHTLVVRPGFVHTAMTAGLKPAPLATDAPTVARLTVAALERRRHTVYAPTAVRWLFLILRALPRSVWRRLPG
jgi:decaprenylphospho-beta-D-erythro-pentofuranosid-2-ulose 2-reductase